MPRFAANLTMLYTEWDFLDRFRAAAEDGFTAVEYLFPYDYPPQVLAKALADHGLQQVLFNAPSGGLETAGIQAAWPQGMRGTACIPGREVEFLTGIEIALQYARVLRCPRVHVMAGLVPQGHDLQQIQDTYLNNLRRAADLAYTAGVELMIEPINTRDMPGYFLHHQAQAHAIVSALNAPQVKVQMDLYHCQIMEGDLASRLRQYLPTGQVGHIQIAGVPDRHEPDEGELHYPYLFDLLDELDYVGWVGCEYRPRLAGEANATRAGLGWLKKLRIVSGR